MGIKAYRLKARLLKTLWLWKSIGTINWATSVFCTEDF